MESTTGETCTGKSKQTLSNNSKVDGQVLKELCHITRHLVEKKAMRSTDGFFLGKIEKYMYTWQHCKETPQHQGWHLKKVMIVMKDFCSRQSRNGRMVKSDLLPSITQNRESNMPHNSFAHTDENLDKTLECRAAWTRSFIPVFKRLLKLCQAFF